MVTKGNTSGKCIRFVLLIKTKTRREGCRFQGNPPQKNQTNKQKKNHKYSTFLCSPPRVTLGLTRNSEKHKTMRKGRGSRGPISILSPSTILSRKEAAIEMNEAFCLFKKCRGHLLYHVFVHLGLSSPRRATHTQGRIIYKADQRPCRFRGLSMLGSKVSARGRPQGAELLCPGHREPSCGGRELLREPSPAHSTQGEQQRESGRGGAGK